jgi:four helix bundle protein
MQDFHQLLVWKKSHELTLAVYRATRSFPSDELYGLTSQMRRAVASIPANIAEGCGRGGRDEFSRFLRIALGSAAEVEYFILLACDLEFLDQGAYKRLHEKIVEIKRMLCSLHARVKGSPKQSAGAGDRSRPTDNNARQLKTDN